MSRPKPCLNRMTASGTWNSRKLLRPASSRRSTCAWTRGSVGTAKGSFTRMTISSAFPGTSTPSQKLSVPSSTAVPDPRKRSSSAERGPDVPWAITVTPCSDRSGSMS